MTTLREAAQQALEALEEIALAGMSGSGQESKEAITEWHARQAWKFIGIAARAKEPLRAALAQESGQEPIGMVLHCPKCGIQHVDEPDGRPTATLVKWDNPPHRSHLCHSCGHIWRPADVPTNGVRAVKTRGKADHAIASPAPKQEGAQEPVAWDNCRAEYQCRRWCSNQACVTHLAPKQAELDGRIELVTAIHSLASDFENALYKFGNDAEALNKAKGDIAHAMSVAAKWNWNGVREPKQAEPRKLTDAALNEAFGLRLYPVDQRVLLEVGRAVEAARIALNREVGK